MKNIVTVFMVTLIIVSMFTLAFNVWPVNASGTIYIRVDGSIDPPTAQIERNGDIYTLTSNITSDTNGIVIERDNITLDGAGYTLQGPEGIGYIGKTNGTYLVGRTNITIFNLHVRNFGNGLALDKSSNCMLLENTVINNGISIWLASSSYNSIIRNRLTDNHSAAIYFWPSSSDNNVFGNNVTNDQHGILLYSPLRNHICNNTITNCSYGMSLYFGGQNIISNNDFSNAGLLIHGTYENVVENNTVNGKPLVYFEKASDQTVEDAGQVILVNCSNIILKNLNLSHTSYPIQLWDTNHSRIINSSITMSNWNGIQLYFSSNNTLEGNNVTGNLYHGIHFYSSSHNILRNNVLSVESYFNFFVDGLDLSHFIHDVDTSNTVNGKPVYYWINRTETAVPLDAGYVALVNCTRMTVENLTLSKNAQAIVLAFTTNSTVTQNNFVANEYAIYLFKSHGNNVTRNTMTKDWYGICLRNASNNLVHENEIMQINYFGVVVFSASYNRIAKNTIAAWYGLWLESCSNNQIFHNNFLGTVTHQFFTRNSINVWDHGYPSGGNYWSNYNGTDLYSGHYQNETGSDGIGDTPYFIDGDNQDNFPLMSPWTPVSSGSTNVSKGGEAYSFLISSNATILDFQETPGSIKLKVSGETGTSGYVRIIQQVGLNSSNIKVFLNNTKLTFPSTAPPRSISTNGTHYFIYFAFTFNSLYELTVAFPIVGDVDYDGDTDIFDIVRMAGAYGSEEGDADYNAHCDLDDDGDIDIFDIVKAATHYGESW